MEILAASEKGLLSRSSCGVCTVLEVSEHYQEFVYLVIRSCMELCWGAKFSSASAGKFVDFVELVALWGFYFDS